MRTPPHSAQHKLVRPPGDMLLLLAILIALSFASRPAWGAERGAEGSLPEAVALFQAGQAEQSLPIFQTALAQAEARGDLTGQVEARLGLAAAYQTLGQICQAVDVLASALPTAQHLKSDRLTMRVKAGLGTAQTFMRRTDEAEKLLRESLAAARALGDREALATILQNLGNLLVTQRSPATRTCETGARGMVLLEEGTEMSSSLREGIQLFGEAAALAGELGDSSLRVRSLLNQARAHLREADHRAAQTAADAAWQSLSGASSGQERAFLMVSCGRVFADLAERAAPESESLRLQAHQVFTEAGRLATQQNDLKTAAFAAGFLGRLYEQEQRRSEALVLTEKALFLAQKAGSSESRFEWEWQAARLLRNQGQTEPSLAAYRRAVLVLQSLRSDLSKSAALRGQGRSFRESTGQVYFELANLLLRAADQSASETDLQNKLTEARQMVEMLKSVEIEDYFYEDDCVSLLGAKVRPLEAVARHAAVVYIIPLPDRTELLLMLPSGMKRVKAAVGARELTETARQFRVKLQQPLDSGYAEHAQKLWGWLIRPLEEQLRQERIETLVFVPDGALRSIPMAALYDGQRFLIEHYAVSVSPGLSLMEPKPMPREKLRLLACGLSESVQGFPALEFVPAELKQITAAFGGRQLLDTNFLLATFSREVSANPYSVVHIASHGEFGSDANETFILAYDGKITLNRLEELIQPRMLSDQPIELLVLSACQTAAGNDRAALGLAGIAVKSGARSALATLWYVNDEAAQRVMSKFYVQLKENPALTRAQALQKAQRALLAEERFRHPCFWSPYLLIGNWL